VLTLRRILYTLQNGSVVSKQVAAGWARETLEERWVPLIERARIGRQNPGLKSEPGDVNETFDFIRYALERSQRIEVAANSAGTEVQPQDMEVGFRRLVNEPKGLPRTEAGL